MRIVSWNLQHGVPDPVGPPDLERAMPDLISLGAQVYGFQELDRRRWRTRFAHQARELGDALAGEVVSAPAKRMLWASQENALVVRGEVLDSEVVVLPGNGERRIAILASIIVADGPWSVGTTHLSLDPGVARQQLRVVLRALAQRPRPRVLFGDLNLLPAQVARLADASGYDLVDGPFTINARTRPNRRLDHVLLDGVTEEDSGVAKLPCSDHLAVWADLR